MKDIFLDLFVIFSPSANYIFQIFKFIKTKSSKGFSTHLCLITILAHTLKVFFWLCEKFKIALLLQSILVITMQLYLIYLCIKYKEKDTTYTQIPNENKFNLRQNLFKFKDTFNMKLIWKWNNVLEYYKFYFVIVLSLNILYLFCNIKYYSNVVGSLSIILDMLGAFPQIYELYKTKTQKNISKIMVFLWFIGNWLKVFYNIYNKCPIQLIIGSYIQACLNIVLTTQIIYYYYKENLKKSENTENSDNSNKIIFESNSETAEASETSETSDTAENKEETTN
jgi:uncharacterized protein with PQ loop repeat